MMSQGEVEVTFRVQAATEPGEVLCVVGDNRKLGQWEPHQALALRREEENDVWTRCVALGLTEDVHYRYFIARITDSPTAQRQLVVVKWEANIKPRMVSSKEHTENSRKFPSGTAVFGEYEETGNVVNGGWLIDQTEVHLQLRDSPIQMWSSRHQQQTYRIKCTAIDYNPKNDCDVDHEDEDPVYILSSQSSVSVAILKDGHCRRHAQSDFGEIFLKDDFLIFTAQALNPESLGFQLDFYVHEKDKSPKHVGYSYVLPADTDVTLSSKTIPITGLKHKPIGQIKVTYFVAKPVADLKMKMDVSYQRYWNKSGKSVDVGHRGLGSSYKHKKLAAVRENTIMSLQSAGSHGADYVEFDVMLSKDRVPVIFHDFHICITYRKKRKEHELLRLPVKDLTLAELKSTKIADTTALGDKEHDIDGEDLDHVHLQPFPTLQECYEEVNKKTGFNVEIKFPQQKVDGVWEEENFWDRNQYIDIILQTTFEHAGDRKIIFSTFDPECCLLLQLKQNRYPVLFLTNGGAKCYLDYSDVRTRTMPIAINFALFADILGIDVCTEVLCSRPENISDTRAAGLVLFCWGDDNNNSTTIRSLREQRVDGIIYDRWIVHQLTSQTVYELSQDNGTVMSTQ